MQSSTSSYGSPVVGVDGECACENMGVCKGEEIVDEAGLWEERAGSGLVGRSPTFAPIREGRATPN